MGQTVPKGHHDEIMNERREALERRGGRQWGRLLAQQTVRAPKRYAHGQLILIKAREQRTDVLICLLLEIKHLCRRWCRVCV
jgi:hypothetical protein